MYGVNFRLELSSENDPTKSGKAELSRLTLRCYFYILWVEIVLSPIFITITRGCCSFDLAILTFSLAFSPTYSHSCGLVLSSKSHISASSGLLSSVYGDFSPAQTVYYLFSRSRASSGASRVCFSSSRPAVGYSHSSIEKASSLV